MVSSPRWQRVFAKGTKGAQQATDLRHLGAERLSLLADLLHLARQAQQYFLDI
jgi:hypothetical protein